MWLTLTTFSCLFISRVASLLCQFIKFNNYNFLEAFPTLLCDKDTLGGLTKGGKQLITSPTLLYDYKYQRYDSNVAAASDSVGQQHRESPGSYESV